MKGRTNINLRNPPNDMDFTSLFKFFWDHGVGNRLDLNNVPVPWNEISLASAFDTLGIDLNTRSIHNWHAGKNKPNGKNLHRLSHIASGGNADLRREWADAFISSIGKSNEGKKKNITIEQHTPDVITPDQKVDVRPSPNNETERKSRLSKRQYVNICAVVIGTILLLKAVGFGFGFLKKEVSVVDIKFCNEALFSQDKKTCLENVEVFPADIQMIYISFNIKNAPEDMPFERRWYRNGQIFLTKSGFYDEAWEDFTYLNNPLTHDPGKYVMRVIINGKSTTGSFIVLDASE